MATTARPLRLPPSALAPAHARPRSSRPSRQARPAPLAAIDVESPHLPARFEAQGADPADATSAAVLSAAIAPSPAAIASARGGVIAATSARMATGTAAVRGLVVPAGALWALALNAALAAGVLAWLLPAPWGGLVPLALLAQAVAWRHGVQAAATGVLLSGAAGAALGHVTGVADWRRGALALCFVALPALLAWPARRASVRR